MRQKDFSSKAFFAILEDTDTNEESKEYDMYYEEYNRRPKRRRRRSCLGALIGLLMRLVALALVLALLAAGALYVLPTGLFSIEPGYDLALTDGLPSSPLNILLLGVDVLSAGSQRSDTMIIASIDSDGVGLTSLQRDTRVAIDGYGKAKLNAAYAYGGPELAMKTINQTFETNIMRYAVVDFTVLVKMVDALGGIEVSISEAEMKHINRNVKNSGRVFAPLGYTYTELTEHGENIHLNGLQALGYARIRKLDSDFARTGRQRTVIDAMLKKLKQNVYNPMVVAKFLNAALDGVETNLSVVELISLGEKALFAGNVEQLRLPMNGTFDDNGSSLTITNRQKNIDAFREFIYG